MSILKVSDLKKSYDKGNTFAVNGISFEVEPQDIVGLLGQTVQEKVPQSI